MRLSSVVAKELRIKHLNEGIKHAQTRSKYRSFKLKEHYSKPQSTKDKFYLHSNIFGTEFIFEKESFDICQFSNPSTAFNLIHNLMRDINQQINLLWVQNRSLAQEEYFKSSKTKMNLLMAIIIIFFFGLCILQPQSDLDNLVLTQENIQWSMVGGLTFIILLMLIVFFTVFLSNYSYFHFDTEVIKSICRKIISQQSNFEQIGIQISCDAELTWICFSSRNTNIVEESQINQFEHHPPIFSPDISYYKQEDTSSIYEFK